jgi:hypothetical protein
VSAEELQTAGVKGDHELFQGRGGEQARKNAYRHEETGPTGDPPQTIQRMPPSGAIMRMCG